MWNTYQCYLKQALNTISSEMEVVASFDKCFGAKIVRGAYMDKERRLARELGYEDPVNESYEATAGMYNRVVDFMLEAISRSLARDRVNIVVATHNEAGALHAASKMLSLGIPPDSGHVVFGQVSSNTGTDILLQKKQNNACFGPDLRDGRADLDPAGRGRVHGVQVRAVRAADGGAALPLQVSRGWWRAGHVTPVLTSDWLCHLSRRAQENRVVLAGARREQELLLKEIRRRVVGM